MEELRFPWNDREGLLYGDIIAGITAYLMVLFNMSRTIGDFKPEYLYQTIPTYIVAWVVVMLLMTFVVGRISDRAIGSTSCRPTAPTRGSWRTSSSACSACR